MCIRDSARPAPTTMTSNGSICFTTRGPLGVASSPLRKGERRRSGLPRPPSAHPGGRRPRARAPAACGRGHAYRRHLPWLPHPQWSAAHAATLPQRPQNPIRQVPELNRRADRALASRVARSAPRQLPAGQPRVASGDDSPVWNPLQARWRRICEDGDFRTGLHNTGSLRRREACRCGARHVLGVASRSIHERGVSLCRV